MAFVESLIDGFFNLSVGGVNFYALVDVGIILAVGVAVFSLGQKVYEKFSEEE